MRNQHHKLTVFDIFNIDSLFAQQILSGNLATTSKTMINTRHMRYATQGNYFIVKKFHPIIFIAFFLGLVGCATNLHSSSDESAAKIDYQQGELNGETIFDILAAELAGNQDDFQYSYNKYLKQAKLTRDSGIAKRTVRIAQHLRNTNKLLEAATLWAEIEPKAAQAQQLISSILLSQGLFTRALPHFNKALELGEKKVLLLLTTQLHKMRDEEVDAYINMLKAQPAAEKASDNSARLVTLGILYEHLDQHQQALNSFDSALKKTPGSPAALYQKAETLKSLEQYQAALDTLEQLLSTTKHDRQYNALQVQLLFQLQRDSEALAHIDTLIQDNPKDRALHNYLALTALDFEHLQKSREIFQQSLIASPQTTAPYFYLGIIDERQNNLESAVENYLKVNDGNNLLQAHTRSISLHKAASDKSRVEQITQQLIARADSNSEITTYVLMLADWYQKFEFRQAAITLLNKEISASPKNTDYLYARATYLEPVDFDAAEQDFKKILSLTPDNPVVLNALGYTLTVHTTRYQEAYTLIKRALELSPEDPATIDSMGWVLFKLKRYQESIKYLSQAYSLYDDPEVASHLIAALASNKEFERAQQILNKFIKSHPDNKFVEMAKKSLEDAQ